MKSAIVFQNQPAVEITDERNKIILSPDRGARLLRWERDGGEVIMWPADANWSKLNKVRGGNPILFPFLARTFLDGRLGFWNDAGTERLMPQHGFGRDMKYVALDEKTENALRMRLARHGRVAGHVSILVPVRCRHCPPAGRPAGIPV